MILAIILAVVLIGLLIVLFAAYYKTFYYPIKNISETKGPITKSKHPYRDEARVKVKELAALPCEFITTRSYDGLKLSARYYQGDESKPLFLCFHGYHGSALRDYSGVGLSLIRQGYPVIMVDERAHWRSQGHTITFGMRERFDVLSWIDYACKRFGTDCPIYLHGISMGGGTVLMASGQKLPDNVKGIISDCPFNDAEKIIRHVCQLVGLNVEICWPVIKLSGLIYGRFNVNKTTAAKEVKKATVPIMIIHGDGDDFVPATMSEEVQKANPEIIERYLIADAGHGLAYYYDPQRYEALVDEFIRKTS
ncbi:alpha/beta hydrolase [Ruminococcus sp.]|uniref:alpha/beta hydrolase n=1 Tax=Ruminococcus sp. TaxID=41978 RepID=UPI0038702B03